MSEEGMMGRRVKWILLTGSQPLIQREAMGNPAKENSSTQLSPFFLLLGVEQNHIYFEKCHSSK